MFSNPLDQVNDIKKRHKDRSQEHISKIRPTQTDTPTHRHTHRLSCNLVHKTFDRIRLTSSLEKGANH